MSVPEAVIPSILSHGIIVTLAALRHYFKYTREPIDVITQYLCEVQAKGAIPEVQ
jgi:hypothetical protein